MLLVGEADGLDLLPIFIKKIKRHYTIKRNDHQHDYTIRNKDCKRHHTTKEKTGIVILRLDRIREQSTYYDPIIFMSINNNNCFEFDVKI